MNDTQPEDMIIDVKTATDQDVSVQPGVSSASGISPVFTVTNTVELGETGSTDTIKEL